MFNEIILNKEMVFWFFALSGSAILIIQLILNIFGLTTHHDISHAHDIDDNQYISNGDETDSYNFKWLSKQAFSGFFTMFGWVGLSCLKEFQFSGFISIVIAFIAGILAMFITGFIFQMASKLHSSGTVFNIEDAIGKEAMVYQQILKNEKGKISLSLNNLTTEIDAKSLNEEDISSFTKVKIINKLDEHTVSVISIKKIGKL
jgi:uncharacterized membrane protein